MKKPDLVKNLLLSAVALLLASDFSFGQSQTFNSSGTFTVPAGVSSVFVECWGAGGGGSTITFNGRLGGGGGGGAYASGIVSVIPGNNYNIAVGTGGAANTAGGSSSFNTNSVVAAGGHGGSYNSSNAGDGGYVAGSTGTTRYAGGNGADGNATFNYSGGGGGGAGSTGAGGNPTGSTGGTGASVNGGTGGPGVTGSSAGQSGMIYGGGGSGASTNNRTDRNGGAGANGLVVISWTQPPALYSYQSGNWNSASTWTTDPSGTLQIGNVIPGPNDIVVILNDRTVTLSENITDAGIDLTIEEGAFLDQAGFRFTSALAALAGKGTLKLATANFPVVTINTFVNAGGGTTEYCNSTGFTLPAAQTTYNNLTINTAGAIATQLGNITLNGNLHIKAGTLRINNNTGTAKLTLAINGNVTVDKNGSFTVGNGVTNTTLGGSGGAAPFLNYYLNFHTVIISGDFTNNGTVKFTNLAFPLYTSFPPTTAGATSGAASVYFQGAGDNTLTCNGTTDFYNLIVNKGTDQTYKLTINSSSYENFRLFGANSYPAETVTGNPALRKALWIYSGTLVLKGSLIIPSLTEGTAPDAGYYIPANGALLIDGVDVVILSTADDYREVNVAYGVTTSDNSVTGINSTGTNSALYVFGKLQVNNGYLSTRESGGIVTSSEASGQIILNGGTIDAKQFLSATGSASYTQTGGLFVLRGRLKRTPVNYSSISNLTDNSVITLGTSRATSGTNSGNGSFNLENEGNIYTVSGGTMQIYDVCGTASGEQEAFDVKSSASNINVSGGTLEIIPITGTSLPDAANFSVNSTAPVCNFTIARAGSSSNVNLTSSLTVKNDLTLSSGVFTAGGNNLSVGGDFTIENGTSYITGSNTTTLNGLSDQILTVNLNAALSLGSFIIDKSSGTSVTLKGSQDYINVTNNLSLISGTLIDTVKTINVSGNVYNSGLHIGTGSIVLNSSSGLQTIDGNGVFGNLTLNNSYGSSAAPVSLIANTTISGILRFSVPGKNLNIGTYNLKLDANASIVTGSASGFIISAGNTGDGGLTKVYSSSTPFTFPVGVSSKYTPATIGFTSSPASYGSVTIIPVGYEHPVTTVNNQSLKYYWRIKSSGFSGISQNSVTHSFTYSQADVTGTETSYVPALYNAASHTWYQGLTQNINTSSNIISDWSSPSNSSNFLDGDYTAGASSGFGTPRIFYSRQTGQWGNTSTWSLTSHTVNNPPSSAPGANDVVIIGNGHTVNLTSNVSCASLQIEAGATLDIYTYTGGTFGMVLSHPNGNGLFRVTTPVAYSSDYPAFFTFPSGDFSDFNSNEGTTEFYDIDGTVGSLYILPANVASYGNLILRAKGGDNLVLPNRSELTISGDLTCTGDATTAWIAMSWNTSIDPYYSDDYNPTIEKTVHIKGNMYVNAGSFEFFNDEAPQHLVVDRDIVIVPGAVMEVYAGYPFASPVVTNTLSIGGSLINNGTANFRSSSGGRNYICNVTFTGDANSFITNTTGNPSTRFNKLTVNKGSSQATTLICNIGGTLNTLTDDWLTLQNGTFIYDRTGIFNISTSTDFIIPATAGLTLNTPSNVYISNSSSSETLYLNGRLRILSDAGNVYIGPSGNTTNNADIEYSGSGASAIEVQGGHLFVNGQIRRPTAGTNGILSYNQSGGDVIVYGNNSSLTKAKLEVLNDGSEFTMSGGTLSIVRGGGTTYGDLYLRPSVSSVTGGTVIFTQIPSGGTTIDAVQSYHLDANIALNDLTITGKTTGTAREAALTLMVSPLELKGSLTLSSNNSIFNSNSLDVSLKGDLNNDGSYIYGTNTTTFNGSAQFVTGSSVTDYYNMVVSPVTSLSVSKSFTVDRNLKINTGTLILSSCVVALNGNFINNGTYTDDNTSGGVNLGGTMQQVVEGTGSFGRLIINNQAGAKLNSNIDLLHDLVLTKGVFDINQYQLTLSQNSLVLGSPFSSSAMIKTDGVISSPGVRKFFNTGAQTFTFPVGVTGKYTPAIYTISASTSVGYIKVNPINANHPSVTDPSKVLKYYWQIESSGIAGFDATATLQYLPDDVNGVESSYVAARLALPGNIWSEALPGSSTDNVDETNHQITFIHISANNLNGDYTAGNGEAIPGEVPAYQTNKDGNWSDKTIWTPVGSSPACPDNGPSGAVVIINHIVTTDINKVYVFSTTINNRLRIVRPTYGHNLGYVYGNGTLYLENGNLPGGNYINFTSCSGRGTLEYGGTGTYTIIATLFNNIPNLFFTGTGTRILPNKDLTICQRLVIDGPTLDNSLNNRKLSILGTMERYNSGAFVSGTGTFPSATVSFCGTTAQSIGGATGDFTGSNQFNNFEINNAAGLTVESEGSLEIGNTLLLTDGIITTSSADNLILLNTSSSAVSPAEGSSTSFVSGPLTKFIVNGDMFVYPLGKGSIKGHYFALTSSAGITRPFTVGYFSPNPTATSLLTPLKVTNTGEYWSVLSSGITSAKIRIGWDAHSDLTPLMATNGISDMRVAGLQSGYWTALSSAASGDGYTGFVETSASTGIYTEARNFTSACVSGTLARAAFSSPVNVCGFTSGISVSFTSFSPINLNYVLNYSIDGVAQTAVTVTSLPFVLPTTVAGAYKLTGFRFNNGTAAGVVDATVVNVYSSPVTSNAGTDQSLCGVSTVILSGNNPSPNSGLWTIVVGSGGSLVSNSQYNTTFNGVLSEAYTLRWTISNGPCTSYDDVIISFPVAASTPAAFLTSSGQVCAGLSGYVYSVPYVAGVTYNWSYSGTGHTISGSGNSVSIAFSSEATSGTLSVTASNNCGTSEARTVGIVVQNAGFSYPGGPFCQNASNPSPVLNTDGVAGTFSSTAGLVFFNTSTGEVNLAASVAGTYIVTNTVSSAVCGTPITATNTMTISGQVWTGSYSTDWNNPQNWSCAFVPYQTTDVIIPMVTRHPVINASAMEGEVHDLTIESGAILNVSNNTISVSGDLTINGSFDVNSSTLVMNGTEPQPIGAGILKENLVENFIVDNPAGVSLMGPLNIKGTVLVQNGNLSSDGYLTLLSDDKKTALIDGSGTGEITGNVTMQRYLSTPFGYKYFSSPFKAATISEFGDDIDLSPAFSPVYRFDENSNYSGWLNYSTGSNTMYPLTGYAVNFDGSSSEITIDIAGEVNNGPLSVILYNNNKPYTTGFNLVGNPFPSPIDWDATSGWTRLNIDDALYFFSASDNDQYGGRYSTYINGVSSNDTASAIIPSMQGFYIHISDPSDEVYPVTATMALDNRVRIKDQAQIFAKSGRKKDVVPILRLNAFFEDNIASADPVVIYFDEEASTGFDSDKDALKMVNSDISVPSLYAFGSDAAALSIDALPVSNDTIVKVPLGLILYKDGQVAFSIKDIDKELSEKRIYLSDTETGKDYDLLDGSECKLYLNGGEYSGRFFLTFESEVVTEVNEVASEDDLFSIYNSHGVLHTNIKISSGKPGTLTIFNAIGQVLLTRKIYEPGHYEFSHSFKDGIYIARFISGYSKRTRKLFIKN